MGPQAMTRVRGHSSCVYLLSERRIWFSLVYAEIAPAFNIAGIRMRIFPRKVSKP